MLKRQREGATVSDPGLVEATIQLLAATMTLLTSRSLRPLTTGANLAFRLSPLRDSSLALPASIIVTLHYPSHLTSKIQSWSSNGSFLMRAEGFPRPSGALRQKSPSAT